MVFRPFPVVIAGVQAAIQAEILDQYGNPSPMSSPGLTLEVVVGEATIPTQFLQGSGAVYEARLLDNKAETITLQLSSTTTLSLAPPQSLEVTPGQCYVVALSLTNVPDTS